MSYGTPTPDLLVEPTYVATFENVNGTFVQLSWYDSNINGELATTNDDFQSAVDALASAAGWTFISGKKSYGTKEVVNPT